MDRTSGRTKPTAIIFLGLVLMSITVVLQIVLLVFNYNEQRGISDQIQEKLQTSLEAAKQLEERSNKKVTKKKQAKDDHARDKLLVEYQGILMALYVYQDYQFAMLLLLILLSPQITLIIVIMLLRYTPSTLGVYTEPRPPPPDPGAKEPLPIDSSEPELHSEGPTEMGEELFEQEAA